MTLLISFTPSSELLASVFPIALLRMDNGNNSSTIMKRDGESGSPWRTPRLRLKKGEEKPLLITQLNTFL